MNDYDPKDLTVILCGILIQGFAPGTFVKVGMMTDRYTSVAGALGDVTRTRSRDDRGTIEVTLMDDSPSNVALTAMASADEYTASGVAESQVKHASGGDIAHGQHSWIKKKPEMEYGDKSGQRVWTIEVARMAYFPGGYGV